MILQWQHTSGFSVHNQVRIACDDTKGQEALAQISEQRETSIYYPESFFPEKSFLSAGDRPGFIYRSKMSHDKNKKNFEVFKALDFIAAITQHIPEQVSD